MCRNLKFGTVSIMMSMSSSNALSLHIDLHAFAHMRMIRLASGELSAQVWPHNFVYIYPEYLCFGYGVDYIGYMSCSSLMYLSVSFSMGELAVSLLR